MDGKNERKKNEKKGRDKMFSSLYHIQTTKIPLIINNSSIKKKTEQNTIHSIPMGNPNRATTETTTTIRMSNVL